MIAFVFHPSWRRSIPAFLLLLALAPCPGARGADKEKEIKKDKEKKEKIEPWTEVRTAHFIVASDGGEKTARRFADQFEALLRVFQITLPKARVTNGLPARLLVAHDGQSFAHVVPEFPFTKTRDQPAGAFVSGEEKTYVAIRANASGNGKFAFQDIFHQYANMVLKLSYHNLPPWVEEGYTSVYNNLTFHDGGPRMERPDPDDMSTLFESPLLPVDQLLGADRSSAYYSPGNKQSVYFAESRVLLHYLITDSPLAKTNAMERYLTAVSGGMDYLQAARDAFGDLNQLQGNLEAWIKNTNGPAFDFPVGGPAEVTGAPRLLTAAESEARIADFLSLRGRDGDAEDKLEDALMMEPSLAEAEQNLGFVELKRDNPDDAQKHLERAAQLDPKDGLNFYGLGLLAIDKAGHDEVSPAAIDAFEKSVALNPEFGPAWYSLAMLYERRDETLPKALNAAQRAAVLWPGNAEYLLELASILDQMGRMDEARKTATEAKETATDRKIADKAGDLVARIGSPKQPVAVAATSPAAKPAAGKPPGAGDSMPKPERKAAPDAKPSSTASTAPAPNATAPTPASGPPSASAAATPAEATSVYARVYSMIGTVSEVTCSLPPQILLTLKSMTISLKLHADNFEKVTIKSADSPALAKENFCAGLRGRTARISYHLVSDKGWDGEIQDVELRAQ